MYMYMYSHTHTHTYIYIYIYIYIYTQQMFPSPVVPCPPPPMVWVGWEPWTTHPTGGLVRSHCATFLTDDHWGGVGGPRKAGSYIYIYVHTIHEYVTAKSHESFVSKVLREWADERLEAGYRLSSVVYFSGGTLPRKRVGDLVTQLTHTHTHTQRNQVHAQLDTNTATCANGLKPYTQLPCPKLRARQDAGDDKIPGSEKKTQKNSGTVHGKIHVQPLSLSPFA